MDDLSLVMVNTIRTILREAAWTKWSPKAKRVSMAPTRSGVGPGEERLAKEIGGEVQGPSVSYDVVDSRGRKWEVKNPDKSGRIRTGVEGFQRAEPLLRQLTSVAELIVHVVDKIREAQSTGEKFVSPDEMDVLESFVMSDVKMISSAEITSNRIENLREVLGILGKFKQTSCDTRNKISLSRGRNRVLKSLSNSDLVKIADILNIPEEDLGLDRSLVIACNVSHPAFTDPDAFIRDNWEDGIKASSVFSDVEGVILVGDDGYRIVRRQQLDSVLQFVAVSQNVPRFKVVA